MKKYEAQFDNVDGWCVIEWHFDEHDNGVGYAVKTNLHDLESAEAYAALYEKSEERLTMH